LRGPHMTRADHRGQPQTGVLRRGYGTNHDTNSASRASQPIQPDCETGGSLLIYLSADKFFRKRTQRVASLCSTPNG
jgi:hypothetical protein